MIEKATELQKLRPVTGIGGNRVTRVIVTSLCILTSW